MVKTIQFELIHHLVSYHLISVGGATDAGGDANKNGDAKVSNRTSQFEKAPRPKHRAGLTSHESRNQEIKYQKMDSENSGNFEALILHEAESGTYLA